MSDKSIGHVEFLGTFEYFIRNGELYRAPIHNPVFPDGYRVGRWEAPAWQIDSAMKLARQAFSIVY